MKIPDKVKQLFETVHTMSFSTSDKNGKPNVVPIASKRIADDETIWVFDAYFKKTKENILQNNKVSLTFWEGHEGYQIKGIAKYYTEGRLFEEALKWIYETKGKTKPRRKGLVEMKVTEIYSVKPTPEDAGKRVA